MGAMVLLAWRVVDSSPNRAGLVFGVARLLLGCGGCGGHGCWPGLGIMDWGHHRHHGYGLVGLVGWFGFGLDEWNVLLWWLTLSPFCLCVFACVLFCLCLFVCVCVCLCAVQGKWPVGV